MVDEELVPTPAAEPLPPTVEAGSLGVGASARTPGARAGQGAAAGFHSISTDEVEQADALDYWEHVTTEVLNIHRTRPFEREGFYGRFSWMEFPEFRLAVLESVGQVTAATRRMIEQDTNEWFVAAFIASGRSHYESGGESVPLEVGQWIFSDSRHPRSITYQGPFRVILAAVPIAVADSLIPHRLRESAAGRQLSETGGLGLVSNFFSSLVAVAQQDPWGAQILASSAPALLASGASLAQGLPPEGACRDALLREHVLRFIRSNLGDPSMDAALIARASNLSVRSLHRLFSADDSDTIMRRLRRMRLERAKALLTTQTHRSIDAIGQSCGFSGQRQFYRAFRAETSMTPAEYRARSRP